MSGDREQDGIRKMQQYVEAAEELVRRVQALIPTHPEILRLETPWDLFKIAAFNCADLQPSLFQATWALHEARRRHYG